MPEFSLTYYVYGLLLSGFLLSLKFCLKYKRLSEKDLFINAYHKKWLTENLLCKMREANSRNRALGVAFIDLDYFKIVNDTRGYAYGDYVITVAAEAIRSVIRRQSRMWGLVKQDRDMFVRYGGDEFILLACDVTEDSFSKILFRIQENIRNTGLITASIGGTIFSPDDELNFSMLMEKTNQAIHAAKRKGCNCVVLTEAETVDFVE